MRRAVTSEAGLIGGPNQGTRVAGSSRPTCSRKSSRAFRHQASTPSPVMARPGSRPAATAASESEGRPATKAVKAPGSPAAVDAHSSTEARWLT